MPNDNEKNLQEGQLEGGLERKIRTKDLEGLISSFIRNRVFKNVIREQLKITTGKGEWYISAYFKFEGVGDLSLSAEIKNMSDSEVGWSRFRVSATKDLRDLIETGRPSLNSLIETAYGGRRIESLNIEGQELVAKLAPETQPTENSPEKSDLTESTITVEKKNMEAQLPSEEHLSPEERIQKNLGNPFRLGVDIVVRSGKYRETEEIGFKLEDVVEINRVRYVLAKRENGPRAPQGIESIHIPMYDFWEWNSSPSNLIDTGEQIDAEIAEQVVASEPESFDVKELDKKTPEEVEQIEQNWAVKLWSAGASALKDTGSKLYGFVSRKVGETGRDEVLRFKNLELDPYFGMTESEIKSLTDKERKYLTERVLEYGRAGRWQGGTAEDGTIIPPFKESAAYEPTGKNEEIEKFVTEANLELAKTDKETTPKQKLGFWKGLAAGGFYVKERKDKVMAWALEKAVTNKTEKAGGVNRFLQSFADIRKERAKKAAEQRESLYKPGGWFKQSLKTSGGIGTLMSNAVQIYRVFHDLGFQGFNPLRNIIAGAMLIGESAEALKEAELKKLKLGTRIEDMEQAADAAWDIYRKAKSESKDGNISSKDLSKIYIRNLPEDLLKKIKTTVDDEPMSLFEDLIQAIGAVHVRDTVGAIEKKLKAINERADIEEKEKENLRDGVRLQYEKSLREFEVMISEKGKLSWLAYGSKAIESLSNKVRTVMMIETLAEGAIRGTQALTHFIENRWGEKDEIFEQSEIKVKKVGGLEWAHKAAFGSSEAEPIHEKIFENFEVVGVGPGLKLEDVFAQALEKEGYVYSADLHQSKKTAQTIVEFLTELSPKEIRELGISSGDVHSISAGDNIDVNKLIERSLLQHGRVPKEVLSRILEDYKPGLSEVLEFGRDTNANFVDHAGLDAGEKIQIGGDEAEKIKTIESVGDAAVDVPETSDAPLKFQGIQIVNPDATQDLRGYVEGALVWEGKIPVPETGTPEEKYAQAVSGQILEKIKSLPPNEIKELGISSGNPNVLTAGDKIDVNKIIGSQKRLEDILERAKSAGTSQIPRVAAEVEAPVRLIEGSGTKDSPEKELSAEEHAKNLYKGGKLKTGLPVEDVVVVPTAPIEPTPAKAWEMPKAVPAEPVDSAKVDLAQTILDTKSKELAEEFYRREQANKFELDEKDAVKVPFKKVGPVVVQPETAVVTPASGEKMIDVSTKDPELYAGQVLVPEKENVFADEPSAPKTESLPTKPAAPQAPAFEKGVPSSAPVFTDAQMAKLMEDVEEEVKSDIKQIYHITWIDRWGAKDWEEARMISAQQFLQTFSGHKIEDKNVFLEGSKDKHAKLFKHFESLMGKTGIAPKESETVEDFLKRLTLEEKKIMNTPLSKVIPTGDVENLPAATKDFSQFKSAGVKPEVPLKNIIEPQAPSASVANTELDASEFDRRAAETMGIDVTAVPPEESVSSENLENAAVKETPINVPDKDGPYDFNSADDQAILEQVRREIAAIALPKEPSTEDFAYDLNQKVVASEALEEANRLGLERELDALSTGAVKTQLDEIYGQKRFFGLFGRVSGENSQYWKHVKDVNIKKFEDFYSRFGKEQKGLRAFYDKENERQYKLFEFMQKLCVESGTEPVLTETVGGYVHRAMKEALAKAHHLKR